MHLWVSFKGTVTFCMFNFIRRSLNDVNILLSFGAKRYPVRSWILTRCVLYTPSLEPTDFLVRIIHTIIGTLWVRNVIDRGFLLCTGFPKDNAKEPKKRLLFCIKCVLNSIKYEFLLNLHYFIVSCSYKIFLKLFKTHFTSVYIGAL